MAEEESVRRSMNPRLNLEAVLCRMAYLSPLIPIEAVLARMEGLEKRLGGGTSPKAAGGGLGAVHPSENGTGAAGMQAGSGSGGNTAAAGTPAGRNTYGKSKAFPAGHRNAASPDPENRVAAIPAAEASAPYRTEAGADHANGHPQTIPGEETGVGTPRDGDWQGYMEFVKRQDPALCAKLESGKCLCCEEGRLRIGFEKGYLFLDDVLRRRNDLGEYGRCFFRRETVLEIEVLAPDANGPTSLRNGNGNGRTTKNHRIQEIRREALSHPLVLKILDVFPGAEVRDVKVIETPATAAAAIHRPVPQPDEEDMSLDPTPPEE